MNEEKERFKYTYEYEYDDAGRVIAGTRTSDRGEYSDGRPERIELSYDDEGNVVSVTTVTTYAYSEDSTETETYTREFSADGRLIKSVSVTAQDGVEAERRETTIDEEGFTLKKTVTHFQEGDEDLVTTWTYEQEKNAAGKIVKTTAMAQGDGVSENRRYSTAGNTWVSEVIQQDGSVQWTTMGRDEEYNEIALSETQVSEPGPYSVTEMTCDADGNVVKQDTTYYDGTTESYEFTYDEDGNPTGTTSDGADGVKMTQRYSYDENGNSTKSSYRISGGDDPWRSYTRSEWAYIEEPSDYTAIYQPYLRWE